MSPTEAATVACWFEPKSPVHRKQLLSRHFWRLDKPGRPEGRKACCSRSPRGLSETACRGWEAAGEAGIRDGETGDRETGVKGWDLPRSVGTRGRMSVSTGARFVWTASLESVKFLLKAAEAEGGCSGGTRSPARGRLLWRTSVRGVLCPPPFAFGLHQGAALSLSPVGV